MKKMYICTSDHRAQPAVIPNQFTADNSRFKANFTKGLIIVEMSVRWHMADALKIHNALTKFDNICSRISNNKSIIQLQTFCRK